jgi:3-hydroxybutyryl-CoA dehydrogenase
VTLTDIGVVGAGIMGAGIAEVTARAGCRVVVLEVSPAAVDAGRARVEGSLGRAVDRGRLPADQRDAVLERLRWTTRDADLEHCELVVEAAPEDEAVKVDLFGRLDHAVRPDAVLATNTSSIPVARIAAATTRPGQVVGLHFFNPVPVLPLVEVVESLLTTPETLAGVTAFAEQQLGKTTIRSKDRAGFIVNGLLIPYLLAAVRMLEHGFASAEDIDLGMVKGCAHPMGPLALADLIGLDTTAAVARSMYAEFKEPLFAPPPLLLRMCEAGLLGRKTGRGFFDYA